MDKSVLKNIAGFCQTRNSSHTFLWGQFHLQKFQEIVPGGVAF